MTRNNEQSVARNPQVAATRARVPTAVRSALKRLLSFRSDTTGAGLALLALSLVEAGDEAQADDRHVTHAATGRPKAKAHPAVGPSRVAHDPAGDADVQIAKLAVLDPRPFEADVSSAGTDRSIAVKITDDTLPVHGGPIEAVRVRPKGSGSPAPLVLPASAPMAGSGEGLVASGSPTLAPIGLGAPTTDFALAAASPLAAPISFLPGTDAAPAGIKMAQIGLIAKGQDTITPATGPGLGAGTNTTYIAPIAADAAIALHLQAAGATYGNGGTETTAMTLGNDGTGLTVGILSDSFNQLSGTDNQAYDQEYGYLPANTNDLVDDPYSGGTDEGRGMAQIVHQIAPGATIDFETAYGSTDQAFANDIISLARNGAKVIVDDLSDEIEPTYQDGVVAQAIETVESEGVVYLSSAGNHASYGYEGAFRSSGTQYTDASTNQTFMLDNFATGNGAVTTSIPVYLSAGTIVTLEWASPAYSASGGAGATSDLGLFLTSGSNTYSFDYPAYGDDPYQYFEITGSGYGSISVGLLSGSPVPPDFKIVAFGNGRYESIGTEASNINSGTLFGHQAAPGNIATGAIDFTATPAYGASSPKNEVFSSSGPDYIYYDDSGNLLSTPRVATVALSGVDGVQTSFFGESQTVNGVTGDYFYGTSAAAPSIAGVAALMLEENANLTPADVKNLLQDSATSQPTVDSSNVADPLVGGSGLVNGQLAIQYSQLTNNALTIGGTGTVLGTHFNDNITGAAGAANTMTGFVGSDTFVFTQPNYNAAAQNSLIATITDFDQGNSGSYAASEGDALNVAAIVGSTYDSGTPVNNLARLVYATSTTVDLQVDPDGTGTSFVTIAQLNGFAGSDTATAVMDSAGYTATLALPLVAVPATITGTATNQTTTSEAAVALFSGVTLMDNSTDVLTITVSGAGGTLSGVGTAVNGTYTLTGSAHAITSELDAASFTPTGGQPNTQSTTTFVLSDTSTGYMAGTPTATLHVTDIDPAVVPTIGGVKTAAQTTTSETPVTPFSTVTVADANNGAANSDTLTITETGTGTLSGSGLVAGANGTYTLTGTAAAISSALDALAFTPVDGVPDTSVSTSFTLQDADAAAGTSSATSAAVTVTDSDPAVAPTIAGVQTATQATTSEATVTPFSTVTVTDANNGGANSDTLTITQTGTGMLSGSGLVAGSGGTYTLTGAAAAITQSLDALVFTPVDGVPNTSVTTSFTMRDSDGTAGTSSATSAAVTVTDSDPAVAPTIAGTHASATTSEAPVALFSGVTIGDGNAGGTDTLTITVGGAGGTLSGAGTPSNGVYTLSGSASTVTGQLDAVTFTPTAGAPGTSSTSTFTLSDTSSAFTTASTDSTTSVVDSDQQTVAITAPASGSTISIVDPTISGMAGASGAGSTITLTSGQTVLGSTVVAGDGSWSDQVMLPGDGAYTIVATDTVNGQAAGSASDTFTLNSTPNAPLFGSTATDGTGAAGQVYALYETILGRAPDPVGFEGWVADLQGGTPLATIAQGFLGSAEYAADYGASVQSDSAFVTQLYEDGLHRAPDAGGLQGWENALADGASRAQVAVGIATSGESQNDLAPTFAAGVFVPSTTDSAVARLYYGLLDRAPDAAGLQGWEGAVANGTSIAQVAQDFLATPEYAAGAVGQGNAAYVEGLYQSALGRTGAPGEVGGWQAALDTGSLTRAGVADDILTSAEFTQDEAGQSNTSFVATLYQAALGRPADPGGQQGWVNALNTGSLTRNAVAQDIVGSAEFQANVTAPSQAAFVNAIYEGALGRAADAGGLQGWQSALSSGASQAGVAVGITQGPEAMVHLAPKIEAGFHIG